MNKLETIFSASPFFEEEVIQSIAREVEASLRSGILTDGPHTKDFENNYAKYLKVKHAVAVSSGTAALEIALRHFKLDGREVIVPTNTFVATPNSVLFAGGKPVFADIRQDTLCINPEDIRSKISGRTAGIIVVHIAGLICPQMEELKELCEDYKLFLLEDAAHAHGALFDNKFAGTLGDAGCFSFYPTKVMTSGEGGMITTNDDALAMAARSMRTHGQNSHRQMVMLGHNWRLSEIAAIIGKHQLDHLEEFVRKRNEIAKYYMQTLQSVANLSIFHTPPRMRHSYYKFPLKLDQTVDRDKTANVLKRDFGIETGTVYYPPCHLHPYYMQNLGTREGDLPVAENVLKQVLCLPMHPGIDIETAKYVCESVKNTIRAPYPSS